MNTGRDRVERIRRAEREKQSREKRVRLVGLCWETEKNGFYYVVSKLKTLDDGPPRHHPQPQ